MYDWNKTCPSNLFISGKDPEMLIAEMNIEIKSFDGMVNH